MSILRLGTAATDTAFTLPLDVVTQSIAILAKKGVGKTYTAAVLCEEIHDAGVPPIIVDPTGAHWGLKASADGKSAGLPFVVFGGEHADLPLNDDAGEVIARAIVAQRFPAILDLSLLRKAQVHRFLVAFFETLYRINRQALHLVCDEADVYAPQKPFGDEARTLGAMQDIVRRGRIRGIGCTLITQRPQVLNKDVLTQTEILFAMRLIHPRDIDAIAEWVDVHADDAEKAKSLIASLPKLAVGTAWVWSPGLDIFERVKIRQRRTFDSSATPKPGEVRVSPEKFAELDLTTLGAELAAAAREARENDPAELKREVARLKIELAQRPSTAPVVPPREIRVPDIATLRDLRIRCNDVESMVGAVRMQVTDHRTALDAQIESLEQIRVGLISASATIGRALSDTSCGGGATPLTSGVPNRTDKGQAPRETVSSRPDAHAARSPAPAGLVHLPKAERLILTCLAQFGTCSKNKIAAITGYAVNGGGFNNALSALRSSGHITTGEPLEIVRPDGLVVLGSYDPLPTGAALIAHWERQLGACEAAIFRCVCESYPHALRKEVIAQMTGYEPNGGGFNNALSRLRTLELITRGTEIRASQNLFS